MGFAIAARPPIDMGSSIDVWSLIPLKTTPVVVCSNFMIVPIITVPVSLVVPVPPVGVQIVVMHPVVSWGQMMVITRRHIDNRQRNPVPVEMNPGTAIGGCSEPVPFVESVPKTAQEIEALLIGDHVNIGVSTGNHYNIGRFGKFNRRGKPNGNADANALRICGCGAKCEKQREHHPPKHD
jgi:hypothetical protein